MPFRAPLNLRVPSTVISSPGMASSTRKSSIGPLVTKVCPFCTPSNHASALNGLSLPTNENTRVVPTEPP